MNVTLLRKVSLTYLLFPNIIFVCGWFNLAIVIPLILTMAYLLVRELRKRNEINEFRFQFSDLIFLGILSMIWTFLSGNGGYSFQIVDAYGHNAKFYDLSTSDWPYYFEGSNRLIRYYFGYYLVPALIFKVLGKIHPSVIFIWTWVGFFIGIAWAYALLFKSKPLVVTFLFMGGIGTILFRIISKIYSFETEQNTFNINIGSVFDQSRWVPNQLIPSLIVSCIMLYDFGVRKKVEESFLPISLSLIWAIFPFISLCIIHLIYFFSGVKWKEVFTVKILPLYLLPTLCLVPILIYFASGEKPPINGFVWEFRGDGSFLLRYILGVFLDGLIICYVYYKLHSPSTLLPNRLMVFIFVVFFSLSLYVVGKWNDWLTKMNISFLVVFLIINLRFVHERFISGRWIPKHWSASVVVVLFLFLNFFHQSLILMQPLRSNVLTNLITKGSFTAFPFHKYGDLYSTLRILGSQEEAQQYMAVKDSYYERNLARKRPASATLVRLGRR
ncbi:hypothetical protein [Dyadobacter crusticola]|uniref:hypothetical protein n=1 Tax=Dyadobacter crusticola TaxID=292407 RepID=UPI0004E0D2DA|nr:hypothetical protein [Dyadobacter crusticola]